MNPSPLPLAWDFPYPTPRKPLFARNVVSTSQPLAAQAGLSMLAAGGNAVDAALAAAIALTVVEPSGNGLGSDAFALVWDGAKLHGLNASGRAPAAWTREYFAGRTEMPREGWDAVTVPGAVAAWADLSRRFGRLPFARLFEPAIGYATRGFHVSPTVARLWAAAVPRLADQPGFADFYLPQGRPLRPGERFAAPAMGETLAAIAESHGEAFYRGHLAEKMAAHARACGGALREADLAAHRNDWVEPLAQDYRGFAVHEIPPNGAGILALMALGMLDRFDLGELNADSADALHLQIEAIKLASADARRHVADPAAMEITAADLLDPGYLAARARLIRRDAAQEFGPGELPRGGTVYLTAADEGGMMVSFIQSNYMGFGSGVVVPGTGISLQNRGNGFSLDPAHPNCVAPGKRSYHTIIPAFLTRGGAPLMSFGVMGGPMQPQGHVQLLTRIVDFGQNPQAACDAPRWRFVAGRQVQVEADMPAQTVSELQRRGHEVEVVPWGSFDFGSAQLALRLADGAYCAASDPRRDSQAVGF